MRLRRDEIEGVLQYAEGWLFGAGFEEASNYLREDEMIAEIADQFLDDDAGGTQTIIYIAGPMTGLPEKNYPAFAEAEKQLQKAGYIPLNPTKVDDDHCDATCSVDHEVEDDHHWTWYLRRTLAMLTKADAIALLPGWEASRGVEIEKFLAHALEIEAMPLEMWLEGEVKDVG